MKDIKRAHQFITMGMSSRDLDHELEEAVRMHADAKRHLEAAERRLADVRATVKAFDAQHG